MIRSIEQRGLALKILKISYLRFLKILDILATDLTLVLKISIRSYFVDAVFFGSFASIAKSMFSSSFADKGE